MHIFLRFFLIINLFLFYIQPSYAAALRTLGLGDLVSLTEIANKELLYGSIILEKGDGLILDNEKIDNIRKINAKGDNLAEIIVRSNLSLGSTVGKSPLKINIDRKKLILDGNFKIPNEEYAFSDSDSGSSCRSNKKNLYKNIKQFNFIENDDEEGALIIDRKNRKSIILESSFNNQQHNLIVKTNLTINNSDSEISNNLELYEGAKLTYDIKNSKVFFNTQNNNLKLNKYSQLIFNLINDGEKNLIFKDNIVQDNGNFVFAGYGNDKMVIGGNNFDHSIGKIDNPIEKITLCGENDLEINSKIFTQELRIKNNAYNIFNQDLIVTDNIILDKFFTFFQSKDEDQEENKINFFDKKITKIAFYGELQANIFESFKNVEVFFKKDIDVEFLKFVESNLIIIGDNLMINSSLSELNNTILDLDKFNLTLKGNFVFNGNFTLKKSFASNISTKNCITLEGDNSRFDLSLINEFIIDLRNLDLDSNIHDDKISFTLIKSSNNQEIILPQKQLSEIVKIISIPKNLKAEMIYSKEQNAILLILSKNTESEIVKVEENDDIKLDLLYKENVENSNLPEQVSNIPELFHEGSDIELPIIEKQVQSLSKNNYDAYNRVDIVNNNNIAEHILLEKDQQISSHFSNIISSNTLDSFITSGISAGDTVKKQINIWTMPLLAIIEQKDSLTLCKSKIRGILGGFEFFTHNNRHKLGVAFGVAESNSKFHNISASSKTNNYMLSLYATHIMENMIFLQETISFNYNNNHNQYFVKENTRNILTEADYRFLEPSGIVKLGYLYKAKNNFSIIPTIGFQYNRFVKMPHQYKIEDQTNVYVGRRSGHNVFSVLELRLNSAEIKIKSFLFSFSMHGGSKILLNQNTSSITVNTKINDQSEVTIFPSMKKRNPVSYYTGFNIDAKKNNMTLSLGYNGQYAKELKAHQLSCSFKVAI